MKYLLLFLCFFYPLSAEAKPSFEHWLKTFRVKAEKEGVSKKTLDDALSGLTPNLKVVEQDQNQPSKKWTFAEYKQKIVHPDRIRRGRELYKTHYKALKDTEFQYGVPAEVIVALWGIESNYGHNTGGFDVVRSLATLAWDGRREKLFTEELIQALKIIDQGHVKADHMKGSWAGAMGQCQFMPSSFSRLARDGNGDGRKDIWDTEEDVFASAANYLQQSGWDKNYIWGRAVSVPKTMSPGLVDLKISKPLSFWQKQGVRLPGGHDLPHASGLNASLIAPDGLDGETFLVYNNFNAIMKWNRSTYFATSVGLLSDQIAQ
ncbi:MAG: lytic murein transglycosylase [Rhodospirillales bacterium]|nr:lytic murein transglycosylase [Rhodospirillales bacterium]